MTEKVIPTLLTELERYNFSLYRRDFLLTSSKTVDELKAVLTVADLLSLLYQNNYSCRVFQTGLGVSIFRDQSTRTRFSYASAVDLLGLSLMDFDESKSQITHGETLRETSNMISFLTEAIGIRDDMYIGLGNKYMNDVGESLDEGFSSGVLSHRPAVVNLQCDIDHPTQTMADLLFLKNQFGHDLKGLKGRKIAVSWAYSPSYGKPLSVPQGLITLMTRFGMDVSLAYPEGYDLLPDTIERSKKFANETGGSFTVTNSMDEAFRDADIVYPKSWAPFEIMKRRTELVMSGNNSGLAELEKECLGNNARFKDWECNADRMKLTRNGEALYMHCLPADITGVSCESGEVAADVFEKYRLKTYSEARYKPFIIAAMILTSRFRDPAQVLDHLFRHGGCRFGEIDS